MADLALNSKMGSTSLTEISRQDRIFSFSLFGTNLFKIEKVTIAVRSKRCKWSITY